jgi:hypothetical protein
VTSTDFSMMADGESDDLPRTLRREREARERASREREAKARAATLTHDFGASDTRPEPALVSEAVAGTVTRFDVPFGHLMFFFLKAVFAAVPALIVLGVMLWYAGAALKAYYPELLHMQVFIKFAN